MASSQTEKGPNEAECPSSDTEEILVKLPIEVLCQSLDQLDNVVDFANIALTCRDWRDLVNNSDSCWEKAFLRDFNQYNAEYYCKLPTWRQKYIACRLVHTQYELRDMRVEYSHAADTMGMLENQLESLEKMLEKLERRVTSESPLIAPLKERIARCTEGLDYTGKVCMRHLHETVAFNAKINSLKAALQINAS